MPNPRAVLTPDNLTLLAAVVQHGSFAAAARTLGLVPSALSYRVRQLEDALDVLLFDRSARQARPTPAARELLRQGERLVREIDSIASRVRRIATGWEPQFTVAVDSIIDRTVVLELCEAFFALEPPDGPPTRLRLRDETLSGTLQALTDGIADLALGVMPEHASSADIHSLPLGSVRFLYAMAPHHALATAPEPLSDQQIERHRAVAVADSVRHGVGISIGLLGGQDVLTVASMQAKLEAQLRGLGAGFIPDCLARPYIETGRLISKAVQRAPQVVSVSYAWRGATASQGRALQWWLAQVQRPTTRAALLSGHRGV